MQWRVWVWALAAVTVFAPLATAQEVAAPVRRVLLLPSTPPSLSPDCRTKRIAGDLFRRPLRALSRAVHADRTVKVLAIGSSSTVGVGASSPATTYTAKLE